MRPAGIVKSSTPIAGSFAVSLENTRPWLDTPIKKQEKRMGGRRKRRMIHPLFHQLEKLSTDPFWKEKLERASYGKFPSGFSYSYVDDHHILTYKKGSKNQSVHLPQAPYEAYSICVHFFQDSAGLLSDNDRKFLNEQLWMNRMKERVREKTWAKTLKKEKEILIHLYARDCKAKYRLSEKETQQLLNVIHAGVFLGFYNKDTIPMERGLISHIDGVCWDQKTRTFFMDPKFQLKSSSGSVSRTSKTEKRMPSPHPRHISFSAPSVSFLQEWSQFLKEWGKNMRGKDPRETLRIRMETSCEISPQENSLQESSLQEISTQGEEAPWLTTEQIREESEDGTYSGTKDFEDFEEQAPPTEGGTFTSS